MAQRPVFLPAPNNGLVEEKIVNFKWLGGHSFAQKQLSAIALHTAAQDNLNISNILEISTKSISQLGYSLSAFNLTIYDKNKPILLEAAYQGSKIFADAGPFPELYSWKSGRDIKVRMRSYVKKPLVGFRFSGHDWNSEILTDFYDWLYLTAVKQLSEQIPELNEQLLYYDAFTDIEFNPAKSINCQARACALYIALLRLRILDNAMSDPVSFVEILRQNRYRVANETTIEKKQQELL